MNEPTRFGCRLFHDVPPWVETGNLFHLRIRVDHQQAAPLTEPSLAQTLLDPATFYHAKGRWWLGLLVLMPAHLHALAAFPSHEDMSRVIGQWKHWHAHRHGVRWQESYFDHRLRHDERGEQLQTQADYILNNPVVKGLCTRPEDWPWKVDRL